MITYIGANLNPFIEFGGRLYSTGRLKSVQFRTDNQRVENIKRSNPPGFFWNSVVQVGIAHVLNDEIINNSDYIILPNTLDVTNIVFSPMETSRVYRVETKKKPTIDLNYNSIEVSTSGLTSMMFNDEESFMHSLLVCNDVIKTSVTQYFNYSDFHYYLESTLLSIYHASTQTQSAS